MHVNRFYALKRYDIGIKLKFYKLELRVNILT